MSTADLLSEHGELTDDLASALEQHGDLTAAVIQARSHSWRATPHLAITERRETAREASADLDIELAKLTGEIDALRARIAHAELRLRYSDGGGPTES